MSHSDLINLWPSLTAFAGDIGVAYGTAKAMRRRGSVPSAYWCRAVEKADERGLVGVTLDALARADAERLAEVAP